jgi:hypothetical protein
MPLTNKDKHWLIDKYKRNKDLKSPILTKMICDKYSNHNYVSRQAVHNLLKQYDEIGNALLIKYPLELEEIVASKVVNKKLKNITKKKNKTKRKIAMG